MRTDMDRRDPHDVLTLCLVATHPAVELPAVAVTPVIQGGIREIAEARSKKPARGVVKFASSFV